MTAAWTRAGRRDPGFADTGPISAPDPLDDLNPTGNDLHFLSRLDRALAAETELALRLYRGPGLVRALFADPSCPPGAARLAIPIADKVDLPHVIIARDGAFVTCLGAGMRVAPHPVLPWERLSIHLHRADELRRATERVEEVLEEVDLGKLTERMINAGSRLSREDFAALAALEPLLSNHYWRGLLGALQLVSRHGRGIARLSRPRGRDEPAVASGGIT